MRFLHLTDTHITAQLGRRKGDYCPDILKKWAWCWQFAADEKCEFLLHTGDVFHSATVPRIIEQATAMLINEWAGATRVPLIVIVGNHDLGRGDRSTIIGKSICPIAFTKGVEWVATQEIGGNKQVVAWPATYADDSVPVVETMDVWAAHKMIVPSPVPWDHLLIDDLHLPTKVVCCGDYHLGWPEPIFKNGIWWCNPGALARTFSAKTDLTRSVRCAIVDTMLLPDCPIKYVDLPSEVVKPVEAVYDAEGKSDEEERKRLTVSVSDALHRAKGMSFTSWEERLQELESGTLVLSEEALDALDGMSVEEAVRVIVELCEKEVGGK